MIYLISGWAVEAKQAAKVLAKKRNVPAEQIIAFNATPEDFGLFLNEVVPALAPEDCVIAYSLGALLLLKAAEKNQFVHGNTFLFAPFFAFPREAEQGGRIAGTQIKFLRRWLKKDWCAAILDFYQRAELDFTLGENPPASLEALDAGLEILQNERVLTFPPSAKNWHFIWGENDALLDCEKLKQLPFPLKNCLVVSAGTHNLGTLL